TTSTRAKRPKSTVGAKSRPPNASAAAKDQARATNAGPPSPESTGSTTT
ncbi:18532_t:CDS:1, partial [Racocetra persica]